MKIIVIASYAPSLIMFRGTLLKAMVDSGHEVLACAPGEDPSVIHSLREIGVDYQSISLSRAGINPLHDLKTIFNLYKVFRCFKPDLALGYTSKPVIYGSLAARLARMSNFYSIITGLGFAFVSFEPGGKRRWKRRLLNKLIKVLYRVALSSNPAVFFQNPDDRAMFLQLRIVKSDQTVLINGSGVDIEHFMNVPPPPKDQISFLLIARLLKDKGIVEYAEAAKALKDRYPDVIFRLVGWIDEGNPASVDLAQLDDWQREGYIQYMGSTNDVRPFLQETSVYVLPSYREGTPRTVLEAMAIGRPIVTTDVPGCRETVVEGDNGFLVTVRDVSALISAMERFIRQPELIECMGRRSREIAASKYDVHGVNAVILGEMGLLD